MAWRAAINVVAPEKEIRIKNRTDPWINNEILQQIENRDKLLKRLTRHRDDADLRLEYNRIRNKLVRYNHRQGPILLQRGRGTQERKNTNLK